MIFSTNLILIIKLLLESYDRKLMKTRDTKKSTMVVSQLPTAKWYELFKDDTYADACLSRLTSKALRLECNGRDMRQS